MSGSDHYGVNGPSAGQARAQLEFADSPLKATKRDLAVEASACVGLGALFGLYVITFETVWSSIVGLAALFVCYLAAAAGIEWWRRRFGRVIPTVVERYRRLGMTASALVGLTANLTHLAESPRPLVFASVVAPSAVAAALILLRGRR